MLLAHPEALRPQVGHCSFSELCSEPKSRTDSEVPYKNISSDIYIYIYIYIIYIYIPFYIYIYIYIQKGIYIHIYIYWIEELCIINWITMTRKTGKHSVWRTEQWTAVSTLLGLSSSAYRDLQHWRSNKRPQNAEPKLYHWPRVTLHTSTAKVKWSRILHD